jgi:hypothetical protein
LILQRPASQPCGQRAITRVDRVVVTNDDVEFRYVIPTTAASEHVRFCHLRADYFLGTAEPFV